ncbi:MAG: outer membrane beta-barrel protein [Syntrophales bacterium LBB04]|nr:outer membrane beta-barrel protein [Syntrophales bacterium LBB04]
MRSVNRFAFWIFFFLLHFFRCVLAKRTSLVPVPLCGTVVPLSVSSLFLLLSSIFSPTEALGEEFRLVPSLALRQEYNDNIFFSVNDTIPDSISTVSPGLELVSKTERTDFSLLGRVDRRMYWAHADLDATDQTDKGSLGYALTPKFRVSGRAGYLQDSRPDRDIETTGLVLTPVKRERQTYGGSTEYTFTEKTMATLGYDYLKDHFRSVKFIDMESNAASLGFTHDLSSLVDATKTMVNFGLARYDFTGSRVENASGTVGLSTQLAELWSVSLAAGARYTRSRTNVVTFQFVPPFTFVPTAETQKSEGTGWVGQAALSYRGEKTTADLTLSRDLLPASGYAGVAERTAASFNVSRRLTYELRGTFFATYYLNKADRGQFSAQTLNQQLLVVNPTLRYEPTKDVAIEASYSYTLVRYKDANQEADRNLFMLRLILQHSFFE